MAGVADILAWAEIVHWRSSGRGLGLGDSRVPTSEAAVVLGFKNRGGRANYLNRYRVRAELRSLDPDVTDSVLVLCGGGVGSQVPEAELMTRYARISRGHAGPIRLDTTSRTTWEEIR